jgi:dipeptidyl-peptidase-4
MPPAPRELPGDLPMPLKPTLLSLAALLAAPLSAGTLAEETQQLTLETLFHPDEQIEFSGDPLPDPLWLPGSGAWLELVDDDKGNAARIDRVEARSGRRQSYLTADALAEALAALPGMDAESARGLATGVISGLLFTEVSPGRSGRYRFSPERRSVLLNHANDLFIFDLDQGRARRLTHDAAPEVGEEFSPDGSMVSFVRGADLYVIELESARERELTSGGSEELLRGRLDWVYQEELYGRGNFKGYWWSPDSSQIAFLELDESPVLEFTVVDHIPVRLEVEHTNYPKAGDPNPRARVGVVNAAGGKPRWIDLSRYASTEHLIVRVGWTPDASGVLLQVQDREQTWLELLSADPEEGKSEIVLREETPAYVEVLGEPIWLPDGSFLWLSDRSGFRHLYRYSAAGELVGQLTSGEWEVRELHGTDPDGRFAFISATEHSPIEEHVYRVALADGAFERLSGRAGTHSARFNPTYELFLDRWSDIATPPQLLLTDAEGNELRVVDANPAPELPSTELGEVSFLQVPARDGYLMEAMLIKPPGFDPTRRYPVLQYNYGGPHAPVVRNRWAGSRHLWHQLLANRGYVIWMCDNRSASGKGVRGTWEAYGQLGLVELKDIEDGVAWVKQQPWVDGERGGIWGWSYGGFMAALSLTHSNVFKAAIAGAPVTDWHLYDSIYTERYMRRPQNNAEGYESTSVVKAADRLSGRLLLIHGTTDDNVHFQQTVKLVYALQRAGKDFELMIYPRSRHRIQEQELEYHMYRLMTSFIERNL